MKKITTIILTMIIGLSMTLAPSLAAEELDVTETGGEAVSAEEPVAADETETAFPTSVIVGMIITIVDIFPIRIHVECIFFIFFYLITSAFQTGRTPIKCWKWIFFKKNMFFD